MKKEKRSYGRLISVIIYILAGIPMGIDVGKLYMSFTEDTSGWRASEILKSMLLLYIAVVVIIYLAMTVQTIVHEGGHLVFGLLTGYRFLSFRIFSFMLLKTDGKLKLKRLSLAGTAGQCLMAPPDLKDGKLPVLLYNFGGAIMNLLFSALFFGLSFLASSNFLLSVLLRITAVMGTAMALINGIPMQVGPINNDGKNAFSLMKDKEAVRAFWIQLKVNEELAKGVSLKEMPSEWFEVPDEKGMKDGLIAVLGVLAENRLMDERKFAEAKALASRLLSEGSGIVGLHRCLLACDLMYIEAIGENRKDVISGLLTKEQQKLMKSMKTALSVLRTAYALDLLYREDEALAEKTGKKIEKVAAKYPYPVELKGERELMDIAKKRADALKDGLSASELLLEKAKALAKEQFAGITDKSGADYFSGHLSSVAALVKSDKEKTVAYLHDIIEDRDYPEEKLKEEFGEEISSAVRLLTHGGGLSEEGYLECIRKIAESGNELAIAVKIADLTNNSDCTRLGASSPGELGSEDRARYEKYQKALKILKDAKEESDR